MPVPIESRTVLLSASSIPYAAVVRLTQMQVKSRVQALPAPMLNQVLRRLERAEILVALAYCFVLPTAVVAVSHQHGYLRT
jgi:predicted MFS family arabinose efflux permease